MVGNDKEQLWYVVYTYSGYENKVKATLEKIIENRNLEDKITEIVIPMEEEVEIKDGKQKTAIKKVFPSYILVKMLMTNETFYSVKQIKGVFNFVGEEDEPTPLTEEEMRNLGIENNVSVDYSEGDTVRITTEPFFNYTAVIDKILLDKGKVLVSVDMFGRKTSVELAYDQIQKI